MNVDEFRCVLAWFCLLQFATSCAGMGHMLDNVEVWARVTKVSTFAIKCTNVHSDF